MFTKLTSRPGGEETPLHHLLLIYSLLRISEVNLVNIWRSKRNRVSLARWCVVGTLAKGGWHVG